MRRLSAPGVKIDSHAEPGMYLAAKGAHNVQPKVNVLQDIRPKNGFFRPRLPNILEIRRNYGLIPPDLMKMNGP